MIDKDNNILTNIYNYSIIESIVCMNITMSQFLTINKLIYESYLEVNLQFYFTVSLEIMELNSLKMEFYLFMKKNHKIGLNLAH